MNGFLEPSRPQQIVVSPCGSLSRQGSDVSTTPKSGQSTPTQSPRLRGNRTPVHPKTPLYSLTDDEELWTLLRGLGAEPTPSNLSQIRAIIQHLRSRSALIRTSLHKLTVRESMELAERTHHAQPPAGVDVRYDLESLVSVVITASAVAAVTRRSTGSSRAWREKTELLRKANESLTTYIDDREQFIHALWEQLHSIDVLTASLAQTLLLVEHPSAFAHVLRAVHDAAKIPTVPRQSNGARGVRTGKPGI